MTSRNLHYDELAATAAKLLADMRSDPSGDFSPSIYETARLVALTPSLSGHQKRIRFLLDQQRADGSWGGPDSYSLIPTLSATDALLATSQHAGTNGGIGAGEVVRAAERGLSWLRQALGPGTVAVLPDTVAVEILAPGLVSAINLRLDRLTALPPAHLDREWTPGRLSPPPESSSALLDRIREAVLDGRHLPVKLLHSLEVLGSDTCGAAVPVASSGSIGCSPAATAAWLGDDRVRRGHPSVRYLEQVQEPHTGAVPVAAPLGLFERAWILGTLGSTGITTLAPHVLLDSLREGLGDDGAAGGDGLPPDADDTAAALYALALHGQPRHAGPLWTYWTEEKGGHVSCFPGERTPSTSTNAHALQAFATAADPDTGDARRRASAIRSIAHWLREQQTPDGYWTDKWHASPYYATACCTVALAKYGGTEAKAPVAAAARWALATQRPEGSWGRWSGTYEETAYAVQILLCAGSPVDDVTAEAAARGCRYLAENGDLTAHPPLWHDKDLYVPTRIVRTEGLAALHAARSDPRTAALLHEIGDHSGRESTRSAGNAVC
ncbi:prenyltransferase/squalene oxidase repeat-containing protein [Amycolatopsis palatopharyngis]|uniref:prenyltransferase/squalene oxidase repeat-containing protein n=1 Tax=Amycolatopsis palatopharyngis TaxID=187982 RepID=UPI00319DA707